MKKLVITILVVAVILFGTSFALRDAAAEKAQAEHLWRWGQGYRNDLFSAVLSTL